MSRRIVVVVPVYKTALDDDEFFSVKNSLRVLAGRDARFVAPRGLDLAFYERNFPGVGIVRFDDGFFASIEGYNALMTSPGFYDAFADRWDFMLLLQPDAVVFRDELDAWMARGFDYVGAPWPAWVQVQLRKDSPRLPLARVAVGVGNGGLSLRRIGSCLAVSRELGLLPRQLGCNEDVFFGLAGHIHPDFTVPGKATAARFAIESRPTHFLSVSAGPPMGYHAWRKFGKAYCPEWFRQAGFRRFIPV